MGQSDELNQKHAQIRNIDITEYTTHNSKRKYQAEASVGNAYRGKRSDAYLPTFNDALKTGWNVNESYYCCYSNLVALFDIELFTCSILKSGDT